MELYNLGRTISLVRKLSNFFLKSKLIYKLEQHQGCVIGTVQCSKRQKQKRALSNFVGILMFVELFQLHLHVPSYTISKSKIYKIDCIMLVKLIESSIHHLFVSVQTVHQIHAINSTFFPVASKGRKHARSSTETSEPEDKIIKCLHALLYP